MPAKKSAAFFQQIIHELAEKYDSVSFQPHITLSGIPDWSEERMVAVTDRLADKIQPPQLELKKLRCKPSPYQKITIEIVKSPELVRLHKSINKAYEGEYSKSKYPHLSLIYSTEQCESFVSDISAIEKKIPHKISCNQLALIHCLGTPQDWKMLNKWTLH